MQHFERSLEGQQARDVVAAALGASSIGAEAVIVIAVVLRIDDIHPTNHERASAFDEFFAAIEDARTLRAKQPFVAISREKVDVHRFHIHRQDAERLYRIDAEKLLILLAKCADANEIVALPAGEFDMR